MKEIEVITGCMFAGKTTELIKRLMVAKEHFILVKPEVDNRESGNLVSTHGGVKQKAIVVNRLSEIYPLLDGVNTVGVDEAQFFSKEILADIADLNAKGVKIVIAGLEKDYLNKPFGQMDKIINIASSVTRLTARCTRCGNDAVHSYRKTGIADSQLLVGDKNIYEALCTKCYNKNKA